MSAEQKPDLQLEIAHLLLIDVVGYSKLLVNEQIELVQELNRIVRSTSSFQSAQKENKLIRVPTGDGMALIFFRSPEEPARCALEISEALKPHPDIKVRMGVHSGPVNSFTDVNDQINVAGAGINVAQRIMDCGDAGHILLSKHVADDLAQYRSWKPFLQDVGEFEVKHGLKVHIVNFYRDGIGNPTWPQKLKRGKRRNKIAAPIVRPVRGPGVPKILIGAAIVFSMLALAVSVSIFFRRTAVTTGTRPAPIPNKSIAVLPFENRSDDKANAYLADGIQDEILTRLAKMAGLKVISRTSMQHYKSTPENIPAIARELGVAHILEGSVQKSGDSVRVNVQLIKAATDSHIWADTFDRKVTDIFVVESEISKAIADQLRVELSDLEQQIIGAKPTNNPEAYDAYLRGLAFTLKAGTTPATMLGARKYLRESVQLDPQFALGWATLSYVDALSLFTYSFQPTAELIEETRRAAETALALQPTSGEALLAMGYYHFACLKDYDTAASFFKKARQFLPNNSQIPESLAYVTRRQGKWDRSDEYFDEAEHLDPRNVNLLTQHALSHVRRRRFPEAMVKLDQVLNIAPDDVDTLALKAAIFQAEGDLEKASTLLAALHPTPDHTSALETQVYQAILERRPLAMITRLNAMLANPDPALGYVNGELRFWLGWAQKVAGDEVAAQNTWRQARTELESFFPQQPQNFAILEALAFINVALADRAAAAKWLERANEQGVSVEKDAIDGPSSIEITARITALMGDADKAIPALEKVLSIPSGGMGGVSVPLTAALVRLDPTFDRIRGDPRLEKLITSNKSGRTH